MKYIWFKGSKNEEIIFRTPTEELKDVDLLWMRYRFEEKQCWKLNDVPPTSRPDREKILMHSNKWFLERALNENWGSKTISEAEYFAEVL